MSKVNNNEEALNAYVSNVESSEQNINAEPKSTLNASELQKIKTAATRNSNVNMDIPQNNSNTEQMTPISRMSREQLYRDTLGWQIIDVKSLPTSGLFYPENTEIFIRAAKGGEIKHWSTMNDQDLSQISQTDDILNYVIEKCVNVRCNNAPAMSWKDLKDVDRMFLLLAVRDFTFPNGDNELMVPVSEGEQIPVRKEMIDFIQIPEELMKYYSNEDRCFVFNLPKRTLKMYIPSLGATAWLKTYAQAKANAREGFDTDFLIFAPMLIKDFRSLTQSVYEQMVAESNTWSADEWSLIGYVRDALTNATEAKIKYNDENGVEVTIPLTFRGGLKSIFTVQNPLSILR